MVGEEKGMILLCFHLGPTAILPQIFFPPARKKYVGSQKVAEVYRAAKCTRLVNLHCGVSDEVQLTVKQGDWISQQKNVFMLVRSVKESYHGNTLRGQFSCKVACLSSDLSFWEPLAWSLKSQEDIVMHTHSYFCCIFLMQQFHWIHTDALLTLQADRNQ